jgi:hypothetical protein
MNFTQKFMDGSPVNAAYAASLAMLIRDAADAEVSEQEEATVLADYRHRLPMAPPSPATAVATITYFRRQ